MRWVLVDLAVLDASAPDAARRASTSSSPPGNVIPLLADGTEGGVLATWPAVLRPDAMLVAGFGLDAAHLPLSFAPVDLPSYDRWCDAAGLELQARLSTWDGQPYDGGGYAVSIHRRSD